MNSFNLRTALGLLVASSLLSNGVLAGLEDAKHSTKLDHSNFDAQIQVPEIGTLVAFFAPWCGHCKNLLTPWDQASKAFESDSKCRIGHFDADASANRDIGSRYGVSGFPTIKFVFKDKSKAPLDYQEARSADAIIKFLNKQCGTFRAPGGLLLPEAGRVAGLDEIAKSFLGLSSEERPSIIEKATEIASSASEKMASYYVKVMNKLSTDESWVKKESERLKKLAEKGATMASDKFEELQIKQNILQAFIQVKEGAERVVDKVTGEL